MAVLDGGLFSRPRGKTGGIVFGAARTRTGKQVTSRLLVPPANPNTTAQQTQRNKFSESLAIVRGIGSDVYADDFNRAISQLPGFQSLMSVMLKNMDDDKILSEPADINLGTLHYPDTGPTLTPGSSGSINIGWSSELGDNGTASDESVIIAIATNPDSSPESRVVAISTGAAREDESDAIGGFSAGAEVLVGLYFRGAGTAENMLTKCKWAIGNAGS